MTTRHRATLLAFVAVFLAGQIAAAAPPRGPIKVDRDAEPGSAAMNEAARVRFNEAVRLYAKKKYDKALAAFLQAYALTGNPAVLFNLGLTSLKLSDPLHAARYFSQYLRDELDMTADARMRAQNGLAQARSSLGTLEITAPEGADLELDGEALGRAPLGAVVDVLPGRHTLTSTSASGTKTEQIEAPAGTMTKVKVGPSNPAAPPKSAEAEPEAPRVAEPPPPPAEPGIFAMPETPALFYVAGAVGVISLTVAVVLRGIGSNAERNVAVATDALSRNGQDSSACSGKVDPTLASTCSSLSSAQNTSTGVQTPFIAALSVGVGTTAFALAWFFFASKSGGETKASRSLLPQATIGAHGDVGAGLDLRF